MEYWVLKLDSDLTDGAYVAGPPVDGPARWRYHVGESLMSDFPVGTTVQFSDAYPRARTLYDFANNTSDLLVVSSRARTVLEPHHSEAAPAEYLPVQVLDHRGGVANDDYFILNLLGSQDAIDLSSSDYDMDALKKDQIDTIRHLALNRGSIDPAAKIFRASAMRRLVLLDDDVLESIQKAKLAGYRVFKADGWNGFDF